MTRRLRISTPVRYALASALAAAGLLMILASQQSRAASPSPAGCPDGFRWERMSGVGCVQVTLPPHAQYSYTSAAICSDPYMAVFAPGPNDYGSDSRASYLIACLTAEEWAARASTPAGRATPALGDGGDANHGLGGGPLDKLAGGMIDEGMHAPDPRDADLGGVAATGVLLLSLAGAVVASGSGGLAGLGGAAGAGGGPAGGGTGTGGAEGRRGGGRRLRVVRCLARIRRPGCGRRRSGLGPASGRHRGCLDRGPDVGSRSAGRTRRISGSRCLVPS